MTSPVGIVGSVQTNGLASTTVASTTAASNTASTFSVDTANTASAANAASTAHSPRLIDDPSAGFITEYLSANGGQVVTQTPSAVAVAYLRLGLTAQGLTKAEAAKTGVVTV